MKNADPTTFADKFSQRTVLPIIGVMVVAATLSLGLLFDIAGKQDERARERAASFVDTAIENRQKELKRILVDYAAWGDAYQNLHAKFDADWAYAQGNLGETLSSSFGFNLLLVVGPDDRVVYSVVDGKLVDAGDVPVLRSGLDRLIATARQAAADETDVASGFLETGGDLVLAGAAALSTAADTTVSVVAGPASIMIFADRLTPDRLKQLGAGMYVSGLRTSFAAEAVPGASLPLVLADGEHRLTLSWDPERPGAALLAMVLPWIAVTGFALGALMILVIRQALRSANLVQQKTLQLAEAHDEAERRSLHDAATGLPNRLMLEKFMRGASIRASDGYCVLFLDLDRFKAVNDAHGHTVGDHVLRVVADRLLKLTRSYDLVARVGGDEFVAVLLGQSVFEVQRLCERMIAAVASPIDHAELRLSVGVSIGISMAPGDGADPLDLVRCADMALYQAKSDGRECFRFYSSGMNEKIVGRLAFEAEMRQALDEEQFVLHYQPRYDTRSMAIRSVEALVRWQHPTRGLVSPSEFIPIAEETGLIVALGEWVLRRSCEAVAPWPNLGISVNVSPAQFRKPGFIETVRDSLAESGLAPRRLELEITEGVLLEDTDRAQTILSGLKSLGIRLAMDDFGTGYSCLGYLQTFPFDVIKIDRSFIANLQGTGSSRAIVRAMLGLGRALDMSVTAEGVETAEQLMLLRSEQCEEVQGFYMSRPLELAMLTRLLSGLDDDEFEPVRSFGTA